MEKRWLFQQMRLEQLDGHIHQKLINKL
jgi:hypothetical protein